MTGTRRVPLWLTIVPPLLGGLVYWHFWSGWRDALRADLAAVMPSASVTIGGFPYRLEADVAAPAYVLGGAARLDLHAARARANRNPWQRDLTVVRLAAPVASANIPALGGAAATVTAASAVASVHLTRAGIARLSTVFAAVRGTTGLFAAPFAADSLEVHVRETRARSNEAWSATPPQQAQVVLAGSGIRFGSGAALALAADIGITATAPLRSVATWADGGTVEVRSATLSDASGEVARLNASVVAVGATLRLAGTVTTVCPRSVAAAVAGAVPPRELRLRTPVRLAFGGPPGGFAVTEVPPGAPTAVRGQLPPCPRLR